MTQVVNGTTTNYVYDDANRMTIVNGVTYTWDSNGNLLNDGVNTYTYDAANRLTTLTDGTTTSNNTYNGQGDRLSQTVDGVTTNYTLDLNAGLTQVLTDGTYIYLYGLTTLTGAGRLGQKADTTEFFLGDALGSVRQLADASGAITLNKSYTPFGEVLSESGTGESIYGYTGEVMDPSGLVYLRARYYLPTYGRFLTKDVFEGTLETPNIFNKWLYAYANPLRYMDPTGLYGRDIHYGSRYGTYHLAIVSGYTYCRGKSCAYVPQIARIFAEADQGVDEGILTATPFGGHPELHFQDMPIAERNANNAIYKYIDPYLFGSSLHQIQDWFSHWNEGFRYGFFQDGHGLSSAAAGFSPNGYSRGARLIIKFYIDYPNAKENLRNYYSGININAISADKLIDLYLTTFTRPGDYRRTIAGYGYDTDHFFGFTQRDQDMNAATKNWIDNFFMAISDNPDCLENIIINYKKPSEQQVLDFLSTGDE